jgi:hypothetical protein
VASADLEGVLLDYYGARSTYAFVFLPFQHSVPHFCTHRPCLQQGSSGPSLQSIVTSRCLEVSPHRINQLLRAIRRGSCWIITVPDRRTLLSSFPFITHLQRILRTQTTIDRRIPLPRGFSVANIPVASVNSVGVLLQYYGDRSTYTVVILFFSAPSDQVFSPPRVQLIEYLSIFLLLCHDWPHTRKPACVDC